MGEAWEPSFPAPKTEGVGEISLTLSQVIAGTVSAQSTSLVAWQ